MGMFQSKKSSNQTFAFIDDKYDKEKCLEQAKLFADQYEVTLQEALLIQTNVELQKMQENIKKIKEKLDYAL